MARKDRIDRILVDRSFFPSRTDAQKAILAGYVKIRSQIVKKPHILFDPQVEIEILRKKPFVSRGGEKLDAALQHFGIHLDGKTALDVGSSTGGFTDCLLKRGARKVYAVDVGYGQLDFSLRNDPRVAVMENVNARYLKKSDFPEWMDFLTVDVSFISLEKILPSVLPLLRKGAEGVLLIKPQFEVGKEQIGKKGVVRDEKLRLETVNRIIIFAVGLGLENCGFIPSPLKGPAGNIEYLFYFKAAI